MIAKNNCQVSAVRCQRPRGFTLLEVVVALAILGVTAG
ncbi:MAG: type II secretion system protein, partial [Acidobacteriota bacterium]